MQLPTRECFVLRAQISALQAAKRNAQTIINGVKDQMVDICENLDSSGLLEFYDTTRNSLCEVEADIESAQSRHEELCA